MRSAARWVSKRIAGAELRSRQLGICFGLLALASCSLYSSGLIDETAGDLGNDTSGAGGRGGSISLGPSSGSSSKDGGAPGSSSPGGSGELGAGGERVPDDTDGGAGAGSGGSSGSAGTGRGGAPNGGTSAAAGTGGLPVTGPGDLLDGFEDADLTVEQAAGRGGVWYLFNDETVGTAGPTPLAPSPLSGAPTELGAYAMHVTATGFTGWGSGLGVDFRAGKKAYDASAFKGIRFWARVGADKNTRHRLQISDGTTDALGGKCNPATNAIEGEKCEDHFGANLTLTTSWSPHVVPFASLSQIGWGLPGAALDKTTLYGLQITAKAKLEVDLWLDQVEFF